MRKIEPRSGNNPVVRTGAKGKANRSSFRFSYWVNVFPPKVQGQYMNREESFGHSGLWDTRREADRSDAPFGDRVACIRVLIQGREGDGLKPTTKGKGKK
jgi:hypothetical protein